jgi:broad specificity phosphatase PhoE
MIITFLRHTESLFNIDHTSREFDCGLSEQGIIQAQNLTGYWPFVLVSPLPRAQLTLCLSSIRYDQVQICPLIREQKVDCCDFLIEEVNEDDHCQLIIESDEQLMDRADQFLHFIKQFEDTHKTILVVSHCEFIHSITARSLYNGEMFEFRI